MSRKTKAILFDLNGTLIHQVRTEKSHIASTYAVLALHHWEITFEQFETAWKKVHADHAENWSKGHQLLLSGEWQAARTFLREPRYRENIAAILTELPAQSSNRLIEEITWAFQDSWVGGLTMAEETPEILNNLKAAGHQLGVVTNFQQPDIIPDIIDQFDLMGFFDTVVVSATEGYRKPHPDLFRKALGDLGLSSESHAVIYVGDDPVDDIQGALFAGLKPILIGNKVANQESTISVLRINDLDELPLFLVTLEHCSNQRNYQWRYALSSSGIRGGVYENA